MNQSLKFGFENERSSGLNRALGHNVGDSLTLQLDL
jgi:hypothetical protein